MGIQNLNGKSIAYNNRVIDYDVPNKPWTINFTAGSWGFSGQLSFIFTLPSVIIVDYGNGDVISYNTAPYGGLHYLQFTNNPDYAFNYTYIYPDGLNIDRTIKIKVVSRRFLYSIYSQANIGGQVFDFNLVQFPALNSFGSNDVFYYSDYSLLLAQSLKSIAIRIPGSQFPIQLATTKTSSLDIQGPFNGISFSESGLDKIALLKNTLTYLKLGTITDDTDGSGNQLPSNFSELINLTTIILLGIGSKVPVVLKTITSLVYINVAYGVTEWGDFDGLINLISVSFGNGFGQTPGVNNLPSTVPPWLINLPQLKTLSIGGAYQLQPDDFIGNLYSFITTNAIMDNSVTSWRNMLINIGGVIPNGTYQQPADYVQGSNNGSPESSLEKIWVMVNQYGHYWYYTAV